MSLPTTDPKPQLAKILRQSVHVGLMVLEDVPAFYRGTSPNKFFDYLSCGLPVVNNYPGWLAELIREHQLVFQSPPRDPEAFAEALIHACRSTGPSGFNGANARTLAESNFFAACWLINGVKCLKPLPPVTPAVAMVICGSRLTRY